MTRMPRLLLPLVVPAAALVMASCSQASRLDTKCVAGDVQACSQLGDMYANGRGVVRDLARAGQSYERACNLGAPDICNTLGEIVEISGEIAGGTRRAEELFQKACEGGSSAGCLNLGLAAAAREEYTLAVNLYQRIVRRRLVAGLSRTGNELPGGAGGREGRPEGDHAVRRGVQWRVRGQLRGARQPVRGRRAGAQGQRAGAHVPLQGLQVVPGVVRGGERGRLPRTRPDPDEDDPRIGRAAAWGATAGGPAVGGPDGGTGARPGTDQVKRPAPYCRT